jgi:hypothetical protein
MKVIYIIFISIFFNLLTIGKDKPQFFRNEVSISLNDNFNNDKKYPTKSGFGAGFYFRLFAEHKLNLVTGVELNTVHFYAKYDQHDHFSDFHNVTYSTYNNTIPISLRYNLGYKIKILLKPGFILS